MCCPADLSLRVVHLKEKEKKQTWNFLSWCQVAQSVADSCLLGRTIEVWRNETCCQLRTSFVLQTGTWVACAGNYTSLAPPRNLVTHSDKASKVKFPPLFSQFHVSNVFKAKCILHFLKKKLKWKILTAITQWGRSKTSGKTQNFFSEVAPVSVKGHDLNKKRYYARHISKSLPSETKDQLRRKMECVDSAWRHLRLQLPQIFCCGRNRGGFFFSSYLFNLRHLRAFSV